jgi:arsenate reductase-like glutaredoxin family protein
MGCKKAQGFLEQNDLTVGTKVDAAKDKRGRDAALALAKSVAKVVVGKGKKVVVIDMTKELPDDDTLSALLLGPTGNLKAPTLRKGNTLLVGFSETAYRQVFGEGRSGTKENSA